MGEQRASRRTGITADVVEAWLASLASDRTRAAYRADLAAFRAWCVTQGRRGVRVDREAIGSYRASAAAAGVSESSVARRTAALNGLFRYAISQGHVAGEAAPSAPHRGVVPSTTVPLSAAERDALLSTLPNLGAKSHVLVALLLLDGLKLDEVLRLDIGDLDEGGATMTAAVARADGEHVVELHPDTAAAVRLHLRRHAGGPLLTSDSRSLEHGRRLTRFGADYLLKRAGREAGLPAPLTANALRRTHVIHAHRHGRSLDDIRRQVGHDDIRTTRRYLPGGTHPGDDEGSRRRPVDRRARPTNPDTDHETRR